MELIRRVEAQERKDEGDQYEQQTITRTWHSSVEARRQEFLLEICITVDMAHTVMGVRDTRIAEEEMRVCSECNASRKLGDCKRN